MTDLIQLARDMQVENEEILARCIRELVAKDKKIAELEARIKELEGKAS